jgi:hypothetical protein
MTAKARSVRWQELLLGRIASEFNGARVFTPGKPEVWLVFHGTRHHLVSPAVYEALFISGEGLTMMDDVEEIQRGADLVDGTCLVRAEGELPIYLVTGFPQTAIRKHYVASYDSFLAFAFSEEKVRIVPPLVLAAVPTGRELRSAAG